MSPVFRFCRRWISVVVCFVFFTLGCERDHFTPQASDQVSSPAIVKVAKVIKLIAPNQVEVVGTVQSIHQAEISAKITGNIKKLPVDLGTRVKRGDLLVEIRADELDARLQQAKAQLEQARRNLKREQKLLKKNAATSESVNELKDTLTIAEAGHREAKTMVSYTRITSPFPGIVVRKYSNLGDLATPGKTLLQIEKENDFQIMTDIPEAMVHKLQIGDRLKAYIPAVGVETTGEISELSPITDPLSRTSPIKLKIDLQPHIRSGQFARIVLAVENTETLGVPSSAVIQIGQMERVFVNQDNSARLRLVRTGDSIEHGTKKYTEILSGLNEGELVVISGSRNLENGQPLTVD